MTLKRKQEIEITIEKLVHGGVGFARIDDFVVMVSGGVLPGQKIRARITRKKKNYVKAQLLEVLEHAPNELPPKCPHFGKCGGCKWLTLPYDEQLTIKQNVIREALHQARKLQELEIRTIIASPRELGYRNKLEFTFGKEHFPSDEFNLGFHKQGMLFDIVDIEHCLFTDKYVSRIVRTIKDLCEESGLTTHSTSSHTGFLRYLIIRTSEKQQQVLINLVHYSFEDNAEQALFEALKIALKKFAENEKQIAGLIISTSDSRADVAKGSIDEVLHGTDTIEESIGEFTFQISPYSFFQTNTFGAKVLYDEAKKAADLQGNETLLDLYAGTGTIGIYLSNDTKRVYSLELNPDAVENARTNATINNIENISFVCGKAEDELPAVLKEAGTIDCAVIDPPRSGMHPRALETIIEAAPAKLVYVSCNPSTLNRDLQELIQNDYIVEYIQPVDMFPQTHHTECVASLRKK